MSKKIDESQRKFLLWLCYENRTDLKKYSKQRISKILKSGEYLELERDVLNELIMIFEERYCKVKDIEMKTKVIETKDGFTRIKSEK